MAKQQTKNASTVSAHVPNQIRTELERRAESIGWSKSQYIGAVLTKWYEEGAAPVAQPDALVNPQEPRGYPRQVAESPVEYPEPKATATKSGGRGRRPTRSDHPVQRKSCE